MIESKNEKMKEVFLKAEKYAKYNEHYNILLTGETGTGKEVVAHFIHDKTGKKEYLFKTINCAGIPDNLLEKILFGSTGGNFTGDTRSIGIVGSMDGGTIFLDEISETSLEFQTKLLRFVETKKYGKLGETAEKNTANVNIIAATNKNLKEAIKNKTFKEDLYQRFELEIHIPPLRERKEDIPDLANHFLKKINEKKEIHPDAMNELQNYDWKGNVRELRKKIISACILTEEEVINQDAFTLCEEEDVMSEIINILTVFMDTTIKNKVPRGLDQLVETIRYKIVNSALSAGMSQKEVGKLFGTCQRNISAIKNEEYLKENTT